MRWSGGVTLWLSEGRVVWVGGGHVRWRRSRCWFGCGWSSGQSPRVASITEVLPTALFFEASLDVRGSPKSVYTILLHKKVHSYIKTSLKSEGICNMNYVLYQHFIFRFSKMLPTHLIMSMYSFLCKYTSKKLKKSCEYATGISVGVLYDYLSTCVNGSIVCSLPTCSATHPSLKFRLKASSMVSVTTHI